MQGVEAGKLFFESLLGHNKQYKKGMALLSFCSRLAPFLDKMHWTNIAHLRVDSQVMVLDSLGEVVDS